MKTQKIKISELKEMVKTMLKEEQSKTKKMIKEETTYEKWDSGKLKGLGSFHTSLMETYRLGSESNRKRLADAFPEYFK